MKKQLLLFLSTAVLLFLASCDPKETNWRENFKEKSKSPFGTYIIANEINDLFLDDNVLQLDEHIYDHLEHRVEDEDEPYLTNYICIKDDAYRLDNTTIDKLLASVATGNHIFLSFNNFNSYLQESLLFETTNKDKSVYNVDDLKELNGTLHLTDRNFEQRTFEFDRNIRCHYFSNLDYKNTSVLGTIETNNKEEKPVFIKINHGKGFVFLHTQPITFTNYYLLSDNKKYVENVLSYLPDRPTSWDPQRKESKINKDKKDDTSALSFFMQHESLRWSLYLSFITLLLFLASNARRKQRAIPEIKKLKNSTKDFTHTIANLYLKEKDHKNLLSKKISYFLEKMRSSYYLDTQNLNTNFIQKLAAKSGNTEETTKYLINTIIELDNKPQCSRSELIHLNTLIDNFLEKK